MVPLNALVNHQSLFKLPFCGVPHLQTHPDGYDGAAVISALDGTGMKAPSPTRW